MFGRRWLIIGHKFLVMDDLIIMKILSSSLLHWVDSLLLKDYHLRGVLNRFCWTYCNVLFAVSSYLCKVMRSILRKLVFLRRPCQW